MKVQNYLIILITGTVLLACGGESQESETQEELVKTVNITTKTVAPSTFASYVRVVGNVETSNDIMISAEVNGRVIDYKVEEGAQVKKGQTIVKIDDSKLKQEKARLEAMTSQTKEQYERLKKVYEEDGIGSELDYLNAKYAYEQSNSALESIKIDLENTSIKAPFNGEVEAIMVEEGEMVSPGMQVVRLIGSDAYKIVAGVPARYSDAVQIGDKVDVWFDTQVKDTLNSAINYVGGSINPQNRTFRIETRLPKNKTYKVDMIANMRLKTVEQSNVLVISEEFVYSKDNRYVVYVLSENEEGKAVANEREVKLGLSYQTNVIIEEGLAEGDKLITLGSAFLDDGMRVTVKDDKKLAAN
ncbi:efflux RND transporter periplasmic adaptor subunit [bacterium]|nr:efflux RND transporter periplasmic adaptor subunit [bacterium]